jgi:hypothetical protein
MGIFGVSSYLIAVVKSIEGLEDVLLCQPTANSQQPTASGTGAQNTINATDRRYIPP